MSEEKDGTPVIVPGLKPELDQLKARAVEMGRLALGMVHDGWQAFRSGNLESAQKVIDRDPQLDRFDQEFEHEVVTFIVRRQPAAGDLRAAIALLKITTHLDRIGRLGFDMARITVRSDAPQVEEVTDLLDEMDRRAESMVSVALDALGSDDAARARQLFDLDDRVDRLYRLATSRIVGELQRSPASLPRTSGEILIARHFERIGDNACKIAERTIYAVTGQRRAEYLPRHPYRPYVLEGEDPG